MVTGAPVRLQTRRALFLRNGEWARIGGAKNSACRRCGCSLGLIRAGFEPFRAPESLYVTENPKHSSNIEDNRTSWRCTAHGAAQNRREIILAVIQTFGAPSFSPHQSGAPIRLNAHEHAHC
jgi:hypothetical protein